MITAHLINAFASMIQLPTGAPTIDPRRLLYAIAEVETKLGEYPMQSRYEAGFRKAYVDGNVAPWIKEVRAYHGGDRVATSYGLTQVMALVAYEMGMPSHRPPEDLYLPYVCLYWTVELLNKRVLPNAMKAVGGEVYPRTEEGFIRAVGDAYNSGNATDSNRVPEYQEKLFKAYKEAR